MMTSYEDSFNDTVVREYGEGFPLLMPRWGYVVSAFVLFLIGFFGFFLNLMVILLMFKDRQASLQELQGARPDSGGPHTTSLLNRVDGRTRSLLPSNGGKFSPIYSRLLCTTPYPSAPACPHTLSRFRDPPTTELPATTDGEPLSWARTSTDPGAQWVVRLRAQQAGLMTCSVRHGVDIDINIDRK
ncbi:unnamed protein product [Euphydryas editha]|uniref:Uncharacterized protein n=1 Tax=Euphydryas editha TaxID=104508 RepID=A0AAU9TT32_EUPED|nr:unnamed protein product [Euphydryas editha]